MVYQDAKDIDVIIASRDGDEEAFNELYKRYYPQAYYIAYAIARNEADASDAAQESLIQIKNSISSLKNPDFFKLWLNRIVLSKCNRIFRKNKHTINNVDSMKHMVNQEEERAYFIPQDNLHSLSDKELLNYFIGNLDEIHRQVIVLMYYEGLSVQEMAEVLQIPEGTVKTRLSNGRKRLKTMIQQYENKEGIHLDFHGGSLETALYTAFSTLPLSVNSVSSLSLTSSPSIWKRAVDFITSHAAIAAGTTAAILCTAAVAYAASNNQNNTIDHPALTSRAISETSQKDKFQELKYENINIQTAKDAYFLLKDRAHCEKDIEILNADEKRQLKKVYQELKTFGGFYVQRLREDKWDTMFETNIDK